MVKLRKEKDEISMTLILKNTYTICKQTGKKNTELW